MFNLTFILLAFMAYLAFHFLNNNNNKRGILLLALSALLVLLLLVGWLLSGAPFTYLSLSWYSSSVVQFSFSLALDFYSLVFFGVGLFVTWSIVEFTYYYMTSDPNLMRFVSTLVLFLFFMLILVSANSLFLLFVGWEGVGILSFILISWWFTRSDANSSALQAVIYNRIGDSGIILFLAISAISLTSWDIYNIIIFSPPIIHSLISIGIIIAAVGKSAQFTLHPWLPSAMEGPTPVSALLHSSTMVVAGVFLLIRTSSILNNTSWGLPLIGLLGSLTALFAASVALVQTDFKKVVAYSTTSQLGLMVIAVSLNLPFLAFFHICTHAFFKALLFLCSGSVIHSYNNEQDLRKISSTSITSPFTAAAIVIASLALCGLPFLAGFYSKDLILEAAQINTVNLFSAFLAFIATLFTSIYTFRTIYFIVYPIANSTAINPISEDHTNLSAAMVRLLIGALLSGWMLSNMLFDTYPFLIPLSLKNIPLILFLCAILLLITQSISPTYFFGYNFFNFNWFFTQTVHFVGPFLTMAVSIKGVLRTLDTGWLYNIIFKVTTITLIILQTLQTIFFAHVMRYFIAFLALMGAILISFSGI